MKVIKVFLPVLFLFVSTNAQSKSSAQGEALRQATVHIYMDKSWYEKVGDDFIRKSEVVCTIETTIGVFDERSGAPGGGPQELGECETTLADGSKAVAIFHGSLAIWNEAPNLNLPKSDIKVFQASYSIRRGGSLAEGDWALTNTTDLNLRDSTIWLRHGWSNFNESTPGDEQTFFSAIVTYVDEFDESK